MNLRPTNSIRQPDYISLVERMKAQGLVAVAPPVALPVRIQKLPATRAVQQPKGRKPICRWCGSLQPASTEGHCKRCGKAVRGPLGVRSRDYIPTGKGGRGGRQRKTVDLK